MPSINMIAVRREAKRRQELNIRKLLYGIGGEIALVALVTTVMTARILVTQGQINDLSERLTKLQPQVVRIQDLQNQTAALVPKVETLDGAKSDTLFWYKSFGAVTDSLASKAWLTSMATGSGTAGAAEAAAPGAASGEDPILSVSGMAMSQAEVGETMLHMNQSPALDHVDLSYVQQQKVGDADAVAFQMTVHLKPEAGATKPADKAAGPAGVKTADAQTAGAKGVTRGA